MNRVSWLTLIIVLSLSACTSTGTGRGYKFGYWLDIYPGNVAIWQCVDQFAPHNNQEC